ncbi:MAG: hypothetical protein V1844_27210 [Pseudomonadota bacterium]
MGFILAFPILAQSFDCNKPDFGARIEDLNKDGYFVKYMEKDVISYYNYTGPCRMDMHNIHNPRISYAFIDNQLYARIASVPGRNDLGSFESRIKKMEERVSQQIGTKAYETKQEGNWTVFQWYNEKDQIKFKLKLHKKTMEQKSAYYYEPLRAKLKRIHGDDDPVSLRH